MLCDLPSEVIGIIAGFCRPVDLCALSRTSKLLHGHASPALYRSIVIKSEDAMTGLREGYSDLSRRERRIELMKQVRSLDVTLPWYEPDSWKTKRAVRPIFQMENLRHLSILYLEQQEYMDGHDLPLPLRLAETLTSCTVGFKGWANWSIWQAACLFQHPSLRQLKLHWASSGDFDPVADIAHGSTELESLALIDCQISPEDLLRMLHFPRALQYLTLATDFNDNDIHDDEQINCGGYFAAIQKTSGKSLKGLRFDVTHWGNVIVPAPGMHELVNVKYLEVAPDHIEISEEILNLEHYTAPEIDCALEHLLPLNLEVLKISPGASDFPTLWKILERKSEIVPRLRKIVLSLHYRNRAMKKELIAAVRNSDDYRDFPELLEDDEDLQKIYPCARKRVLRAFRGYCEEKGVELMLLHEDAKRKEILEEGAGPAVWEIEDQVR